MLTLTNSLPSITFSRNPVRVRLQATDGTDPYGPQGATAEVTMNVGGLQVDDTLGVSWTEPDGSGHLITFTAKATPTTDTHVQAQPSGLGAFEYFQLVAEQLEANPIISAFFTVAASSPSAGFYRLTFTALDTSEGFACELDITDIDAGSSPTTSETAAVADNTPDDYAVFLDVFFEAEYDSETFTKVAALEGRPDAQGFVDFDIQSVLHAQAKLSWDFTQLPDLTEAPEPKAYANIRRYYVRYREDYDGVYDNPLNTDGVWVYTKVLKTMMGGISQALWSGIDFFGDMDNTYSLLTWYPPSKTVSLAQPEFLPWYNWASSTKNIVLQVIRQTADTTMAAFYTYEGTPLAVPTKSTAIIPVGHDQLVASGVGMDDVLKYTVRVVDADSDYEGGTPTYLSPARSYFVDRSHYEELRYIVYLNSFFCPMTLRITGELDKDLEVESVDSNRTLPIGYTDSHAEAFTHDTSWSNPRTYRSGYLGKLEVDALQELLIYRQAWEIRASGYAALMIQGRKFKITSTLQFLHAVEFTATRSLRPVNYSGLVAVTDDTADFWELEDSGLFELQNSTGLWKLETT